MAGAVGFEPTIHDTKNRCLTTWLRPIMKLWPRFDELTTSCQNRLTVLSTNR